MPLIILSGYPCSGKSTRAQQIATYFRDRLSSAPAESRESRLRVHIVSPDALSLTRSVYRGARTEKEARATEYSAVQKLLSKDDVVIADGLNYIKGFRYQLFCEAKSVLTPSCVVQVATPVDKCKEWNTAREGQLDVEKYDDDVIDSLIFRYEEPNGMVRWDSPLFVTPHMDEKPDLDGIWEALVGKGVVVKPNQATIIKPAAEGDHLYELDKTTQEVVSLILENQKSSGGGAIVLPVPDSSVPLELPGRSLSLPQLQRIRRQFVAMNRKHSVGKRRIRELFVEHLNANLQ